MIPTRRTGHLRRHRTMPPSRACLPELLLHVASLPPADRAIARARVVAALALPPRTARAALGRLALELAVAGRGAAGHVRVLAATATAATPDLGVRAHPATAERAGRGR